MAQRLSDHWLPIMLTVFASGFTGAWFFQEKIRQPLEEREAIKELSESIATKDKKIDRLKATIDTLDSDGGKCKRAFSAVTNLERQNQILTKKLGSLSKQPVANEAGLIDRIRQTMPPVDIEAEDKEKYDTSISKSIWTRSRRENTDLYEYHLDLSKYDVGDMPKELGRGTVVEVVGERRLEKRELGTELALP